MRKTRVVRKISKRVKKTVKRGTKLRKAPKRSMRKIAISSRERGFVIPISIRIPIYRRPFTVIPLAPSTPRKRLFWTAIFGKKFSVAKSSLVLMLTVGLNIFGFLSIGNTVAFYNDTESSNGNVFIAGSLDFTVDVEKSDNRFTTFTQGGWGSRSHGNNPGAYRDLNFASAFPGGALIGDASGFTALFTDTDAVEDFLPAGGTPGALGADYVDPVLTGAGVLAGQVLALTLNVGFDLYDPDFAPSINNLKEYVINDSSVACDGMTVEEVLNEANAILGGLPSSFSASEINECATWVNEEFDDGSEGGLVPGGSITQFATIVNGGTLGFQYTVEAEKTGGDGDFCNALDLEAVLEGTTNYTGDLMAFVSSPVVYSDTTDEWEFIISLPFDADEEGSCSFDFVFSGWQTNLPNFGGFSDIERVDDPIHSVASVTVESGDGNGGTDFEGESAIQEFGLDNEPKVEDALTEEDIDITGDSGGDGGNDVGDGQADGNSDEGMATGDSGGGEQADESPDEGVVAGDAASPLEPSSEGPIGEQAPNGASLTGQADGGAADENTDDATEPDAPTEPLPSDPLPPATDPTADSSSDSVPEPSPSEPAPEPAPAFEPPPPSEPAA